MVLALVALVAAGLAVFGVATYTLYSHSQHQHLDEQIRSSQEMVLHRLESSGGSGLGGPGCSVRHRRRPGQMPR